MLVTLMRTMRCSVFRNIASLSSTLDTSAVWVRSYCCFTLLAALMNSSMPKGLSR